MCNKCQFHSHLNKTPPVVSNCTVPVLENHSYNIFRLHEIVHSEYRSSAEHKSLKIDNMIVLEISNSESFIIIIDHNIPPEWM
jgi:hypothetical protein